MKIAFFESAVPILRTEQDALDLVAEVIFVHHLNHLIISKTAVAEEFFDLSSRLAGNALQKFTNYGVQLAIVGDFSRYQSQSLADFMRESNKGGRILFVPTKEEALRRWVK